MSNFSAVLDALREAIEQHNAGAAPHARLSGVNADDEGMATAEAGDLLAWADDLEARVGLDVDGFRAALYDYIDERDTARALAWLEPLVRAGWVLQPYDVRGMYCAGAELYRAENGAYVGLYINPDNGAWETYTTAWDAANSCDGDDEAATWHSAGEGAFDPAPALLQMQADVLRLSN